MANIKITDLPAAGPITGSELVPIVQQGITVRATTAAVAGSPSQTQTFLTLNQEPTLPNSRALSGSAGIGLVDGGALSTLQITLNGVSGSLETSGTGLQSKTGFNTVVGRSIASGDSGISVTNGDGQAGNPTIALDGLPAALAGIGGTGMLAVVNGTAIAGRQIYGTSGEVVVTDGNGAGNPTISLDTSGVTPGTYSYATITVDDTGRVTSASSGTVTSGTVTNVTGTANQISVANGTTTPTISISSNPVLPGTASVTLPKGDTAARSGSPTSGMLRYNTDIPGFEGYINGAWTSLAAGSGVTSVGTGTGLTGGPITSTGTISIDNTVVATLSDTQTLTNKTISGSSNTLTNIPNSALTNSSVTIGTTAVSLGGTTTTLAGLTSITLTQDPTADLQVATKQYVDSIASGLNYHQPVNYASTTTLPAYTYNNGTSGVGATITANANGALSFGGGSPTVGQRLLVKDEVSTNAPYNGIYTVTQTGSLLLPFILTRATDYDSSGTGTNEIDAGDYVLVLSGTNASTAWVQQTPLPITVGTTAIVFLQFNSPITYTAGTGLNLSPATTFNISNTGVTAATYGSASSVPTIAVNAQGQITSASNTSIAINGNQITSGTVGSAYISGSYTGITGVGTLTAGTWNASTIGVAYGGTGQTTYTDGQLLIGNSTGNTLTKSTLNAGSGITITNGAGSITISAAGGSGTVTSVAQTFTGGLISVSGSPITTSGTLALTVAGTSGGIPYFDSASSWASSAALGANQIMVGGGAGAAPSTVTTGTGVVTALGVNTGSAGAFVVNGGALGTPSSGTVTNLTGTASININGTVGATTPNTGAFTTVSASGVITSTVATGTAPFTVASTTQVANLNAATAGTATNATNVAVTANSTNATNYLTFVSATTGNLPELVNSSITCNPSTGAITGGISGGTF